MSKRPLQSTTAGILIAIAAAGLSALAAYGGRDTRDDDAAGQSETVTADDDGRAGRRGQHSGGAGGAGDRPAAGEAHWNPPPTATEQRRMRRQRASYRRLASQPEPGGHQVQVMRRMELSARYPPDNQAITEADLDPVLRRRQAPVRTVRSEDGTVALSLWWAQRQVPVGDGALLHAQLLATPPDNSDGQAAAPQPLSELPTGTLVDTSGAPVASLSFVAGPDGGALAELPTGALRPGAYLAVVQGPEVLARASLTVYTQQATLTGSYREQAAEGHLLVESEVAVTEPGVYLISGTLYADEATPVGFASGHATLEAGTHWLPLRFFGRVLLDSGLPGPYRLQHVHVARRAMPASGGHDADPGFTTAAHPLSAFDPAPYNDLSAPPQVP